MLRINNKTRQDFLDREWARKLLDAGVDMSDANYFICGNSIDRQSPGYEEYILLKSDYQNPLQSGCFDNPIPTYTLSELLLKLDEWPYNKSIKNEGPSSTIESGNSGGVSFFKDAPFYCFFYKNWPESESTFSEYPIYAAANLLLWCMKNGIGCVEDVSDK